MLLLGLGFEKFVGGDLGQLRMRIGRVKPLNLRPQLDITTILIVVVLLLLLWVLLISTISNDLMNIITTTICKSEHNDLKQSLWSVHDSAKLSSLCV